MGRFKKEKFIISGQDSVTIIELKAQCNNLIDKYNFLGNPLSEAGEKLSAQINAIIMKINELKDSNYENRR